MEAQTIIALIGIIATIIIIPIIKLSMNIATLNNTMLTYNKQRDEDRLDAKEIKVQVIDHETRITVLEDRREVS